MNRIYYNTEEVFFGSPDHEVGGSYLFITGYQILKRLDKVQSVTYGFESPSTEITVLGTTSSVDTFHTAPPSASVTYNYYIHGVNNEKKAGFYVQEAGMEKKNFFSNIVERDTSSDRKNFYLASNQKEGQDIKVSATSVESLNFDGGLTSVDTMTDPNSEDYDLFVFQNTYITSYEFDVQINSLAEATVGMVADNALLLTYGKWIDLPKFNSKSGIIEYENPSLKVIVPKRSSVLSQEKEIGRVFRDGDISVSINKKNKNIYTSDFSTTDDGWEERNCVIDHGQHPPYDPVPNTSIRIIANGLEQYHRATKDLVAIKQNTRYKVTAQVFVPAGAPNVKGFQFRYSNGHSGPIIHPALDEWYDFSYEFVPDTVEDSYDGWIEFWLANSSTVDTSETFNWAGAPANADHMYVRNVVVTEILGIDYFNDKIQSASFQASVSRSSTIYLGHKHYHDRKPTFPIEGQLEVSFLADVGIDGSLFETIDNNEYDVHLSFKNEEREVLKYSFEGAKCSDFSSSLSIGDNKMYNASFSLMMDLSDHKKGFFVSGESEVSFVNLVDDSYNQIVDDSNNEIESSVVFY